MQRMFFVMTLLFASAAVAWAQQPQQPQQPHAITVNVNQQHQKIDGFGTCLVSWKDEFQELYRTERFQKVYTDELGMNIMRINLWGPVSTEPVEDWRDISWKNFDMTVNGGRAQIFVDFAQGIKKNNPDVKLIGTAWSPPPWMKLSKSVNDERAGGITATAYEKRGRQINNRVDPKYYKHFAKWLVEMAKLHEAAGVPLYAISPGNEVQFTQDFESCVWTAEDYAEIVKLTGQMLEEEGLDVKIFGPETMTGHNFAHGNPPYIKALMSQPEVAKHFDIFATHGYTDGFEADMSKSSSVKFWDMIKQYDRPYWMTEGGTGGHDWPEPLTGVAAMFHNSLVGGNASAVVPWQVVGGHRNTHCLMVLENGRAVPTAKTAAAAHFTKFIHDGAFRVDASPAEGAVRASAYAHPDSNELTIVLLNPTQQEQPVRLAIQGTDVSQMQTYRTSAEERVEQLEPTQAQDGSVTLTLPAQSIVTLTNH